MENKLGFKPKTEGKQQTKIILAKKEMKCTTKCASGQHQETRQCQVMWLQNVQASLI